MCGECLFAVEYRLEWCNKGNAEQVGEEGCKYSGCKILTCLFKHYVAEIMRNFQQGMTACADLQYAMAAQE